MLVAVFLSSVEDRHAISGLKGEFAVLRAETDLCLTSRLPRDLGVGVLEHLEAVCMAMRLCWVWVLALADCT